MEFKKGQSVYDTAGYEYYYNQKLENGHLVNKIIEVQYAMQNYSCGGYDLNSEYQEGEPIILYEVFDMPPKQKKCDEIVALDTAIKALREKESDIKKAILEKGKELANVKTDLENKIKEFPNHDKILKILNNDFSVYYINGDRVGRYEYGKIMFDVKTGEIDSIYRDDYCSYYYIGEKGTYKTLEDAEKAFINNAKINEDFLSKGLNYYLNAKELFEKYNEDIPEYIINGIEIFKEKEQEQKKKDLEYNKKYANEYLEKVKKLEIELYGE